jgi:hypothetical protein
MVYHLIALLMTGLRIKRERMEDDENLNIDFGVWFLLSSCPLAVLSFMDYVRITSYIGSECSLALGSIKLPISMDSLF